MRALRAVVGGLVLGTVVALLLPPAVLDTTMTNPGQDRETRGERLFREYECWTNDGQQHPEPQGALVTMPGHETRIYPAEVGYGIWLEDEPGTLHGFCKEGPK